MGFLSRHQQGRLTRRPLSGRFGALRQSAGDHGGWDRSSIEFDFNKELEPYVRNTLKDYFSPTKAFQKLQTDLLDHLGSLVSLPEQMRHVLAKIEKGEIGVKIDTADLEGMKREFDRQNDLRILGIVLTAVGFGTAALLHLEGKTTFLVFL